MKVAVNGCTRRRYLIGQQHYLGCVIYPNPICGPCQVLIRSQLAMKMSSQIQGHHRQKTKERLPGNKSRRVSTSGVVPTPYHPSMQAFYNFLGSRLFRREMAFTVGCDVR